MPGTKKLASMVLIFFMTISGASAQRLVSVGPQVGSLGGGAAAMVSLGGSLSVSGEFGFLPWATSI